MSHVLSTAYAFAAELRRVGIELGGRWSGHRFGPLLGSRLGPGSEYAESRPYVPGDELRRLDRRMFQKSGEVYVYDTIAERELDIWFVVKHTRGMAFGSKYASKQDLSRGLIAASGLMFQNFNPRYGLILAGGHQPRVAVELASYREQMQAIDSAVKSTELSSGGSVGESLEFAAERATRRSLFVYISDLLDDSWQKPVLKLAEENHVLVLESIDPAEMKLPFGGLRCLINPDTGDKTWTWITSAARKRYQIEAINQRKNHVNLLANTDAIHTQISNNPKWVQELVEQVQRKSERRWSA